MASLTVIKNFDIFKDFLHRFCACCKVEMMHKLCLKAVKKAFTDCIIPTVPFTTHTLCNAIGDQ